MADHKPFTLPPGEGAKVCVGGGAGFIGSHIAKRLKENGYHVTVVGAFAAFSLVRFFSFLFTLFLGRLCKEGLTRGSRKADTEGFHLFPLDEKSGDRVALHLCNRSVGSGHSVVSYSTMLAAQRTKKSKICRRNFAIALVGAWKKPARAFDTS